MAKKQLSTTALHTPNGVFSQATTIEATGRLVFVSGMTSRRAGGTLDDVCRVDVYVRNMEDFAKIHEVRAQYFSEPLPASTMVEVSKLAHPDYLIEINAIAVIP
jgi:2-iminobutanoate/2-iminopropanoate deaminase